MKIIKNLNNKSGFTLLEILLVVAAIGILAGIVIFAINPAKQLADTRNAQRKVDVNTILNALSQYAIDNNGVFPTTVATNPLEICKTGVADCGDLTDLSVITLNGKYLMSLPVDPQAPEGDRTGYFVSKDSYGHATVSAPYAEQDVVISVTR
jgi:prepilin-type N-terminal cleavage/methylation domain-containing protein